MKLVGIKRFVAKKTGTPYTVINVVAPYHATQIANGCVGSRVEEIFLPSGMEEKVKDNDIGKEINIEYDVIGGRSYVVNISVGK